MIPNAKSRADRLYKTLCTLLNLSRFQSLMHITVDRKKEAVRHPRAVVLERLPEFSCNPCSKQATKKYTNNEAFPIKLA
jgi:hypothetical protein